MVSDLTYRSIQKQKGYFNPKLQAMLSIGFKTWINHFRNTVISTDLKEEPIKGSTKKGGKTKKKAVTEYHSNPLDMTWIHPESYSVTNR